MENNFKKLKKLSVTIFRKTTKDTGENEIKK